jgi:hypothetical protein
MKNKLKYPETIHEFLDERIAFCKTFPDTHPNYKDAKNIISKCLYCKSLDEKHDSLQYGIIVNDIIDEILKSNYKNFSIDAPPIIASENIISTMEINEAVHYANESIKDIHGYLKAIEKLKITNSLP